MASKCWITGDYCSADDWSGYGWENCPINNYKSSSRRYNEPQDVNGFTVQWHIDDTCRFYGKDRYRRFEAERDSFAWQDEIQ